MAASSVNGPEMSDFDTLTTALRQFSSAA